MANIIIRVLSVLDGSTRNVFDDFKSMSKKANDTARRDVERSARDKSKTYDADAKKFEKSEAAKTKAALREETKRKNDADRAAKKLTRDLETEERKRTQTAKREEKQRIREREKSIAQTRGENRQIVRDTMAGYNRITSIAGNAFGNVTRIAKTAVGMVTGFAGAIGVDTSITSIARRGMDFEKSIVDTTNSGSKHGASPEDIARTRAAVEGAAGKTFTDQNAMADALGKYVSLTGDLESGISSLEMFGKLARATGTDVADLAGSAGQIANGLGDVPDKAKIVEEALRVVAQQGKLGSVEIRDLATHMGKFASKAQFFEGSRENAMATLGAVAQLAMKGGASTAAEAASAAGNFNRDISTDAAKDAFKKYGVERRGKSGRLRDASDIIIDALVATKGDGEKLQEMFRNQSSRKGVLGAAGIFNAAGGGKAGAEAVRKEFDKLRASISGEDVDNQFQASAGTREAKATDLNNRIQQKVGAMIDGLMPAFERLIPVAESLANSLIKAAPSLAKFAETLVDHPGLAITGAIVGSIAKAGLGEAVKGSLGKLLEGLFGYFRKPAPGGGGGPAGAPAAPGAGGANAAAVLAVGTGAFFGTRELLQWGDAQEKADANDISMMRGGAGRSSMSLRANDTSAIPDALRDLVQLNKLSTLNGLAIDAGGIKESRDNLLDALMKHGGSSGMLRAIGLGNSERESNGPSVDANEGTLTASAKALEAAASTVKSAGLVESAATLMSAANALSAAAASMGGSAGRVPGGPT